MLSPFKIDVDEMRRRAEILAGAALADGGARRDDPEARLVEHWQRLFAERRAGKTGSA